MNTPNDDSMNSAVSSSEKTLCERASERLQIQQDPDISDLEPEEVKRLVHELRMHQIELEVQNDELRRTHEALEVAQERYIDLYDFAPVGYVSVSEAKLILKTNLTAATLLGVPRTALINQPLSRFILPADQDIYYHYHNQLAALHAATSEAASEPRSCELRMLKSDETPFWAQLNATKSIYSYGTPVFRIVLSDITRRKEAVEALRQSELLERENRFRNLFVQHSAVMLILDAETGRIVDANKAAVRFYGWSLDELRQMSILEINTLPSDTLQNFLKKVAESEGSRFEFRHRRADGSIRWVEVFSNGLESKGNTFLVSIVHDITERKQIEYEREATIEFLRFTNDSRGTEELIHAATAFIQKLSACEAVGIRLKEKDDYPYYETRGFSEEFVLAETKLCARDEAGRSICDSAGNPVLECMCGNVICGRFDPSKPFFTAHGSFWSNSTTDLLASTSAEDRQSRTRNRCNGEGYESVALIPLQLGKERLGLIQLNDRSKGRFNLETIALLDRLSNYLAVALAKFRAEEKLQAFKEDLEMIVEKQTDELLETQKQYLHAEKLSAIGKLSASIAHEVNNPLQGIMTILKGLEKYAILKEEDRELLELAIGESKRIRDLIQSLQDFNRPSSGRKEVMDIHKSIDSMLLLCKKDFARRRINLVCNYAEQLPQILAVKDQIKQVLINLLTNAAEACQPGGVITISTWLEDKWVAIAIKDTGIGIASDRLDQIFQPFYSTKAEVKGTGLGLSISHGIIQKHHGKIRVESKLGEGSTFTILLPA